jgi:hypothetical protein
MLPPKNEPQCLTAENRESRVDPVGEPGSPDRDVAGPAEQPAMNPAAMRAAQIHDDFLARTITTQI